METFYPRAIDQYEIRDRLVNNLPFDNVDVLASLENVLRITRANLSEEYVKEFYERYPVARDLFTAALGTLENRADLATLINRLHQQARS